jgi:hypothetical protein
MTNDYLVSTSTDMDSPASVPSVSSRKKSSSHLYDQAKTKKPQSDRLRQMLSRSGSPGSNGGDTNQIDGGSVRSNRSRGIENTIQEAKESIRKRLSGGSNHSSSKESIRKRMSGGSNHSSSAAALKTNKRPSSSRINTKKSKSKSDVSSSNYTACDVIEDILGISDPSQRVRRKDRPSTNTTTHTTTTTMRHVRHKSAPEGEIAAAINSDDSRHSRRRRSKQAHVASPSRQKSDEKQVPKEGKEAKRGRRKKEIRMGKSVSPDLESLNHSRHSQDPTAANEQQQETKAKRASATESARKSEEKQVAKEGKEAKRGRRKSLSPNLESSNHSRHSQDRTAANEQQQETKAKRASAAESRRKSEEKEEPKEGNKTKRGRRKSLSPNPESAFIKDSMGSDRQNTRSLSPHAIRASSRRYTKDTPKPRASRSLSPHEVRRSSRRFQNSGNRVLDEPIKSPSAKTHWAGWTSPLFLKDNVSPLSCPSEGNNFSPPVSMLNYASSDKNTRTSMQIPWMDDDDDDDDDDDEKDGDFGDDSFQHTLDLDISDEFKVGADMTPILPNRLSSDRAIKVAFGQDSFASELDLEKTEVLLISDAMPPLPSRRAPLQPNYNPPMVNIEDEKRRWAQSKSTPQAFKMASAPRDDQLFSPVKANPRIVVGPPSSEEPASPSLLSKQIHDDFMPLPPVRAPKTGENTSSKNFSSPKGGQSPKLHKSPRSRKEPHPSIEVKKTKLKKKEEEHEYWRQSETSALKKDVEEIQQSGYTSLNYHSKYDGSEMGERFPPTQSRHWAPASRRMRDIEKDLDPFAHSHHSLNSLPNMKKQLRERKARSLSPHGVRASSKRYSGRNPRRNRSPLEDP